MMEGVRESIKRHSTATLAVMAIVIAGALFFTLRNASSSTTTVISKAFCTTDEGQTTFVADMANLRLRSQGQDRLSRVDVHVQRGKTRFPGYLERFMPRRRSASNRR